MRTLQPNRREILMAGAAGGLTLAAPLNYAAIARAKLVPKATHGTFAHGVSAGFPHPDSMILWTRVSELGRSATVELEVAKDKHFKHVVHRAQVLADATLDHTVHARVTKLKPATEYFYRFATTSTHSRVGRFRTAPPRNSKQPLKIGFYSCSSYEAGYYTALGGLAAEDLDFVICLGDYIYEHHYYKGPAARTDRTGKNKDGDVQTLAEYRQKYRLYQTDPHLQAMHAAFPFVSVWDDHEVEDNYAGNQPDSKQPNHAFENDGKTKRRVPFGARRKNGYQAFFEAMPRIRPKGAHKNQIYGSLHLGGLVDLFLTDQRQYRTPQACEDVLITPCADDANPKNTLLGKTQKQWFKHAVPASKATWKLWGSEIMIMSLDISPGNHVNPDQWDGYSHEREEILGSFVDRKVKNFVGLTGDIHTFLAGNLSTTGNNSGRPVGVELVGGSATSFGLPEESGIRASALDALRKASDPHITFADFTKRGYCVIDVKPKELTAEFKSVNTKVPNAKPKSIAKFRVASGTPKLETL